MDDSLQILVTIIHPSINLSSDITVHSSKNTLLHTQFVILMQWVCPRHKSGTLIGAFKISVDNNHDVTCQTICCHAHAH